MYIIIIYTLHYFIMMKDTGKSILNICQRNVQRNADTPENVLVRELNWHTPFQKGLIDT